AQRAATETTHARKCIQHDEAGKRATLKEAAFATEALQKATGKFGAFDPTPKRGGHGAAQLFNARVHVLGGVEQLVALGADFLAYSFEAGFAGFQVGNTNDVVVGHGYSNVTGCGRGERPVFGFTTVLFVELEQRTYSVQISGAVGRV